MTETEWVVVLEAADTASAGGISYDAVHRLLIQLVGHDPTGLYAPDRYAVQLVLPTGRPGRALDTAQELWEDAVAACGLPQWELVRAEVKTIGELRAELAAEAAVMACDWPQADGPRRLVSVASGPGAEADAAATGQGEGRGAGEAGAKASSRALSST
jgi:hypothetical protein